MAGFVNQARADASGADVSYAITEAWSIEASYYYVDTFSTCKLYKHDQHVVSLGVAWKF